MLLKEKLKEIPRKPKLKSQKRGQNLLLFMNKDKKHHEIFMKNTVAEILTSQLLGDIQMFGR